MNDAIRQCPRCGERTCDHDERLVADALALVGTGVINVDLLASYRWIASLRRHARTAFVELKRNGEEMGLGQKLCLLDITGTLHTENGLEFEQRAFVLARSGAGFDLSSFWRRGSLREPPNLWSILHNASATDCAVVIADWLKSGKVVFTLGE